MLIVTTLSFFVNSGAQAHIDPSKFHIKQSRSDESYLAHYRKIDRGWSEATLSNSQHLGLINGMTAGRARAAGDTQSN
jgi:hypothetical protein